MDKLFTINMTKNKLCLLLNRSFCPPAKRQKFNFVEKWGKGKKVWREVIGRFDQLGYRQGELSWRYLFFIGRKNILRSFTRTMVTVGAIASGTAAIVVLVGFAYGLEAIVTDKLIQPDSLRLTDVQSTSTAYKLDQEALTKLGQVSGVEAVSASVNLAGSVKYQDAQTEVVIVGARNAFLTASHIELVAGQKFSADAEMVYAGEKLDLSELFATGAGEVAGASTELDPIDGERSGEFPASFRIVDGSYVPLRRSPDTEGEILGYVRGSVLDVYQGYRVWGSAYDSPGVAGKAYQLSNGGWKGEWLELEIPIPIYNEIAPTVYSPVVDAEGKQTTATGYLAQNSVLVLSDEDAMVEKALRQLSEGMVLGESTESADLNDAEDMATASAELAEENTVSLVLDQAATSSASETELLESIISQSRTAEATKSAEIMIASVTKPGGKEVIVSTGFLNNLKLTPEEVIGKNLAIQYIISGGLVPGVGGKITSTATEYSIIGVFTQDDQSIVFAPLSDLESMGVEKYSLIKVLASDEATLSTVRERIGAMGYRTRSIADTLLQVNKLFAIMRFLLGSFGMIAFIVALFGMFNTLTVSLLERTREIGVMKTLGTIDSDIKKLLIIESTLIGASGGFLGVGLGVILGYLLNAISLVSRLDRTANLFAFPVVFLLLVFILATGVGILTGFYPARRAKTISALNALRYE